jgi:hypothetical protein
MTVNYGGTSSGQHVFFDTTSGNGGAMTFGLGTSVGPHIVGNTNTDGTARGAYSGSRMFFNSGGFTFDYSSTTSGARSWTTYVDINTDGVLSIRRGGNSNDNVRFYNTDGNYSYIRTTAASNSNNTWFDAPLGATIWLGWDNPGGARTSATYSQVYVGTGRGTINESVLIKRGDIEGKDSSGNTNFRIVTTGALGSHTYFNYGNVGIGTTAPSLHSSTTGLVVRGSARGIIELWDATTGKSVFQNVGGDTYIGQLDKGTGSGRTYILVNGNGSSADIAMTLLANSNVGIGNTTPSNLLTVGSQAHTSPSDTNRILNFYSVGSELHNSVTPIVVGNSNTSTSQPQMVGLSLFNRSTTNNTWSPMITFGGLSTSGSYMNGAAGIAAQLPANTDDNNFRGGNLVFYTSGTVSAQRGLLERVRISSDGNMGIGTSSPASQLSGTKGLSIVDGTNAALGLSNGTNHWLNYLSGTTYRIWNNSSSEVITILLNGNVGIGTNSAGQKLHVAGYTRTHGISLHDGTLSGFIGYEKNWIGSGSSADIAIASEGSNNIKFYTNGNTTVRMMVNTSGNVGVATTSPNATLDVAGSITGRAVRVSTSQKVPYGHYNTGETVFEIDPTWTEAQLQDFFGSTSVTWEADSTAPGYCIRITGGVNVGGVYNSGFPYIPVDSSGGDWYYMECWIRNEAGSSIGHYMGGIDFNQSFSSLGGNPGSFTYNVMLNYNPGTSWTKVTGYWNGFGTGSGGSGTGNTNQWVSGTKYFTPQALFNYSQYSGTIRCYISGWKCIRVSNPGNRYFSNSIYASSDVVAYFSSDIRLKDNINIIQSPLEKISKLRGIEFNWNNNQNIYQVGKRDLGVIAQDVEDVLPELVETRDTGYKAVKYEKLTPLLIEAIKEQQVQIEEQKTQNQSLLNRIESLESQLQNRGI